MILFISLERNPINKIKVTDVYDLTIKLERLMIIDSFKEFDKQEIIYCKPYEFMNELTVLGNGQEKDLMFNIEDKIDSLFDCDNDKKNLILVVLFMCLRRTNYLTRTMTMKMLIGN